MTEDDYTPTGYRRITIREQRETSAGGPTGRMMRFEWDATAVISATVFDRTLGTAIGLRVTSDDLLAVAAAAIEERLIDQAREFGADAGRDAAAAGDDEPPEISDDELAAELDIDDPADAPMHDMLRAWEEAAADAFNAAVNEREDAG